jgi:predicted NAD/FAD-binding protein
VRIAIIGTGIAGLYTAHRLQKTADLTLFEAGNHAGGHSNTVEVVMDGQKLAIDTGFIVFNERNYPNFTALLRELDVPWQPSEMTFSLSCRRSGLEYCGSDYLNQLFAQRRNLFRPRFLRMIADMLRLNRSAARLVASEPGLSLGAFLEQNGFSGPVVEDYLLPMAAAIWSVPPRQVLEFPACHFGRFFVNHGLLSVNDRPRWMTVTGGSHEYVKAILKPLRERLHLNTPVEWIERYTDHVVVKPRDRAPQHFDQVVLACHSDEALALLRDPSPQEREILGAMGYQPNEAVLHTDDSLLPDRRLAWASWNYHRWADGGADRLAVTYNLTRLQRLPTHRQFLVTLNASERIAPGTVIQRMSYSHPVYNSASFAAQRRHGEISGQRRTWYCGAYWGYGFHEDGVRSAMGVVEPLVRLAGEQDGELYLSGTG